MKLKSSAKGSDYLHNVIVTSNNEKIFRESLGGSNLEDVIHMIIDHYKNSAAIDIKEHEIFRTDSSKNPVRLLFDKLGQKGVQLKSLLSFLYTCDRRRDFEKLLTHFLEAEPVSIVVHPLEKMVVKEGTELQLNCRATGFPYPRYSWVKDKKVVGEGETLRIPNITCSYTGEYTCDVRNHDIYGAIRSLTCHVDVQHNPCPRIIAIQQFAVALGNETMLKCEARGDPPLHFDWYKVSQQSQPEFIASGDTLRLLLNGNLSRDRYRCTVMNGFGNTSYDIAISHQPVGQICKTPAPMDPPRLVTGKLALFIGVTQHDGMDGISGRNDSEKIIEILDRYDFETVSLLNLNRIDMWKAIRYFAENVPKGSFVFVYVAAHGISVDKGSFIIPPDVPSSALIPTNCIAVEEMLRTIQKNEPDICVSVIDTCRIHRYFRGNTDRPMACLDGTPNQLVFYSTLDGKKARQSLKQSCSIFTKHFVPRMKELADTNGVSTIFQEVKRDIPNDPEICERNLEQTAEIRDTLKDYNFHFYDIPQSRVAKDDKNFSRLVSESSSNSISFFNTRINGILTTKQIHSNLLLIEVVFNGHSERKMKLDLYCARETDRVLIPCVSYTPPNPHGILKWTFELPHLEHVKEDPLVLQVELVDLHESSTPDLQVVKLRRPVIAEILSQRLF